MLLGHGFMYNHFPKALTNEAEFPHIYEPVICSAFVSCPRTSWATCFAGHSHHAFLLLPEADVILKCQEVEKELEE